ncbi:hypothetical protein NDU88_005863 [Pleurodeles waltl]|uniref:Uncharacterized protein n=1 Tax=Pleurodeles waltl TaxID=8319 RepID=A0AAV7X1Y5_PLEWA|nr:hypothetical protein NDU88_005863 [Pleurodeles waltl]
MWSATEGGAELQTRRPLLQEKRTACPGLRGAEDLTRLSGVGGRTRGDRHVGLQLGGATDRTLNEQTTPGPAAPHSVSAAERRVLEDVSVSLAEWGCHGRARRDARSLAAPFAGRVPRGLLAVLDHRGTETTGGALKKTRTH